MLEELAVTSGTGHRIKIVKSYKIIKFIRIFVENLDLLNFSLPNRRIGFGKIEAIYRLAGGGLDTAEAVSNSLP